MYAVTMTKAIVSCWMMEMSVSVSKAFLTPLTVNSSGTLYWRINEESHSKRKYFGMTPPNDALSAAKYFSHRPTTPNTVQTVQRMYCENRKPNTPEKGGRE
jgi:hypothetical protein